jgi:glycine/D-amino acid oxidase-like deaminating enzyme
LTAPLKFRIAHSLFWNDSDEYLIQRADGRVVLGGRRRLAKGMEVNVTDDSQVNPQLSKLLRQFMQTAFPKLRNQVSFDETEREKKEGAS